MKKDATATLKAARAASRHLDLMVALQMGWKPAAVGGNLRLLDEVTNSDFFGEMDWIAPDGALHQSLPRFTESFDAAYSLLPPGWRLVTLSEIRSPFSSHPHHWQAAIEPWGNDEYNVGKGRIDQYGPNMTLTMLLAIMEVPRDGQ